MQQDPYGTNPYDAQNYEAPALPYVPYAAPIENTSHSYNAQEDVVSNDAYPPTPSVYENMPSDAQTLATTPQAETPAPASEQPITLAPAKKKRRLWIPIGVAILIALIIAASTFVLVSYLNRSTPTKTLDTFCSALQEGKYQTAYDQFTPTMQTNFTEKQFATLLSTDSVSSCSHGMPGEDGTSTTTALHLLHRISRLTNDDKVVLTKDSHSQWKINDIQKAS